MKMEKKFSGMGIIFAFASFPLFASTDFSGEWSGVVENHDSSVYSTLNLKLKQEGEKLTGVYCYITRNGNRIDCPDDNANNLQGSVYNNQADVYFDSSFGGKHGKADLAINDGEMRWHLISKPQSGEFYAPEYYTLKKKMNTKPVSVQVLSTPSFMITLVNNCGDFYSSCNDIKYYGMKKKDKSQLTLTGHTIGSHSDKINGMVFKNGDTEYRVNFEPLKLSVLQKGKVLVEQAGKWE